jgi:hypothetical protein
VRKIRIRAPRKSVKVGVVVPCDNDGGAAGHQQGLAAGCEKRKKRTVCRMTTYRFRNTEQLSKILSAISDAQMRKDIEAMQVAGLDPDEIADIMPAMIEQCERARLELLAKFERIVCAPSAPSHELN